MVFNEMKVWYVGYKLFIYLLLNNSHKTFFIYKAFGWIFFQ